MNFVSAVRLRVLTVIVGDVVLACAFCLAKIMSIAINLKQAACVYSTRSLEEIEHIQYGLNQGQPSRLSASHINPCGGTQIHVRHKKDKELRNGVTL